MSKKQTSTGPGPPLGARDRLREAGLMEIADVIQRNLWKLALACALLLVPISALAQGGLTVTATPTLTCGDAAFEVTVGGGSGTYNLDWDFGDGEFLSEADVSAFPHLTDHAYPGQDDFAWELTVADSADPTLLGMASGVLSVGPTVALNPDSSPPIYFLDAGGATVNFTADVSGGSPPYTFEWDLDGDGAPDPGSDPTSSTAAFTYTSPGKFSASVTVTDDCGLSHTDTITILIIDPDTACHPRAQQIANAVSFLFPDKAQQLYTCEDIYDIFRGGLTGSQVGFGRMWHAYKLALELDLTWEEIRDWHLDGFGWGHLLQLNKAAQALGDVDLRDLMTRVLTGENTVKDIRTALRMFTRYDADFEDALARIAGGASSGKLGQFYRTAQSLGLEPAVLDGYLDMGMSIAELRHAAKVAGQTGADWASLAEAHAAGHSWGEIKQAYRLAEDTGDPAAILDMGVKEFRSQAREERRAERQDERDAQRAERNLSRIASQYGATETEVQAVYDGQCSGDWNCVRDHFKDLRRSAQGQGNGKGKGKNK